MNMFVQCLRNGFGTGLVELLGPKLGQVTMAGNGMCVSCVGFILLSACLAICSFELGQVLF